MKKILLGSSLALLLAISCSAQLKFVSHMNGPQEVPANNSAGFGTCLITLNTAQTSISASCTYTGLGSTLMAGHIHGVAGGGAGGGVGINSPVLFGFPAASGGTSGSFTAGPFTITAAQLTQLRENRLYVNLHTVNFPGGEIRGQIKKANTVFDFDGDGRTDPTVFRASDQRFYTRQSMTNTLQVNGFGATNDTWFNLTGDFDGDGRGDPVLFRLDQSSGRLFWSILQTRSNTVRNVQWGLSTPAVDDLIAPADYDGDGVSDIAVFRRSTGFWYIIESSTGNPRYEQFGTTGDTVAVGDYDGDGRADLGVVRLQGSNYVWYIRESSGGAQRVVFWGSPGDSFFLFAPIDIDGDGKQDIGIARPVNGQYLFAVLRSSDGQQAYLTWGRSTPPEDEIVVGDYDGDGKTDIVAIRNVGGQLIWQILRSSGGADFIPWGTTNDQRPLETNRLIKGIFE
ncbi:MAG TPA: CHRD domain-containing protein [Pyrinomonadaceae bacterium]|nr:CHRD domain-containing protein [Pyrinomonadaceae bacterium]